MVLRTRLFRKKKIDKCSAMDPLFHWVSYPPQLATAKGLCNNYQEGGGGGGAGVWEIRGGHRIK